MSKGFVQVYTGNGKGKTTAALGLALRAVCAGKKVYMGQFVKSMKYNEAKAEKYLPGFKIEQYGQGCFIDREPSEDDIRAAEKGLEKINQLLKEGKYDIVILDEINIAVYYNLLSPSRVVEVIDNKKEDTEIVLTGRYAHDMIIKRADLVTEMKEIKHYFNKGIKARDGIER
ncbi:MAG: cob(I)yrinic acid a,c-diamide adenosyltransferase [Halanaerobiales bacterium]|nr:cob(I)yrinic acid a,c-diamide adenosyltransferase [Halanaerobiales bacterium]